MYGADTKLPKKISEVAERLLPPQNSMTESVCIIFLECILRITLFGHFFTIFAKKRDAGGTSFSFRFLIMTLFLLALFQGFALDQCVVFSRAVIRFGMFAVVK